FIVDKDDAGFKIGKIEHKMGIRGSQTSELIFEDVVLPADRLLGKENGGFKIAMTTLDGGRIGIASQALGIAQGALDQAVKYMKERVQFGKTLDKFQGLQWMVADMATKIDAARLLVRRAAFNKDNGLPYTKEAAMAKLFAAETAMEVTTKCVQIYGGYGYIREYPMERMMRDAKITEIYEGTSQVQRMVIAGQILRK
ncbi:MAG: acyl-CoA dehydrogenase family protein, partial [Butyricicoccus sp.]